MRNGWRTKSYTRDYLYWGNVYNAPRRKHRTYRYTNQTSDTDVPHDGDGEKPLRPTSGCWLPTSSMSERYVPIPFRFNFRKDRTYRTNRQKNWEKQTQKKLRNRWKLSDVERFSPASGASLFCFAKKNSILPVAPGYGRQVLSGESPSPVSGRISA